MKKILSSGYTTLFAAFCAVIIGFLFPNIGKAFKPFSDIFLALISVSVIPIIFSSITCSIIKILSQKNKEIKITSIILIFLTMLVVSSAIGVVIGILSDFAKSISNSELISDMIFKDMQKSIAELSINEPLNNLKRFDLSEFFVTLLPKNPFEAFAKGNIIQILVISILVGFAISTMKKEKKDSALAALDIMMSSFKSILKIPTKILPLGVFFLLSSNLSEINFDVLVSMWNVCLSAFISFGLVILISFLMFAIYSPIGLLKSISALKESITVGFSTCSNQATFPFLISALSNRFKLPQEAVDLSIPLGVTMCRVSNSAYYALVTIFIASVYNEPLSISQYGFIVFGSVMTSFAASGATGVIAISMITIILDPLNLPIDSVLVLLVVIDPIIEPFRTVTSLIMNAALSCFVINKKRKKVIC